MCPSKTVSSVGYSPQISSMERIVHGFFLTFLSVYRLDPTRQRLCAMRLRGSGLTRLLARNIYLSSDLPPNKKLRIWAHNFRLARHPTTIRWEPPLASAPAVSRFRGIVLSQCAAACV